MSPEVETRRTVHRREIAGFLREFADGLDGTDPVTLSIGDRRVTIDPPERLAFDVEIEDERRRFRRGERSMEFELSWRKTGGDRPI